MSKTAEEEIKGLEEGTEEQRMDARERAERCWTEVHELLRKYNCRIYPQISPEHIEPVGKTGGTIQVTASYGIFPLA